MDVFKDEWAYTTLTNPPVARPEYEQRASSIYQGIVPAKNIDRRDFAINGSVVSISPLCTYIIPELKFHIIAHHKQWLRM